MPIVLGFFAKLMAIKSQSASDALKLAIERNIAKESNINSAREFSKGESVSAQWFRRSLVFILLIFICFIVVAPVFFDIDLVVKVDDTTSLFFGLVEFNNVEFQKIDGLLKFDEIFQWVTMIIEFYFGGQLAKGK